MSADATRLATRPFKFEIYDASRANPVDASDGVTEFSSFTSTGSLGEVSSATLHLDARHGWLLTQGRPALSPTTAGMSDHDPSARGHPIDQFALCRLTVGRGDATYSRYLEVRDMKPQSNDRGLSVLVEFACLERNLKDILIPGHWWFHDYREVLDAIISHYNSQKGALQPTLSLDPNTDVNLDIPTNTPVNFYAGTDCYTAIEQLIDRLRQPAQAGGIGDYVSAYYTDGTDHTSVILHIVRQGDRGTEIPVIEWGDGRVSEVIRTRLPSAATRTVVRGAAGAGTMPMHLARASSAQEEFHNAREWHASLAFAAGALVAHGASAGPHYSLKRWRAKRDVAASATAPADGADWEEISEWEHLRPHLEGVAAWQQAARAAGGMWNAPTRTFNDTRNSVSYPDSNLVIRDLGYWQDWVHYRVTSAHPLQKGAVEGTRALVVGTAPTTFPDGTSTGLSAGQVTTAEDADEVGDLHGNADNSIIQVGRDGTWFVARRFPAVSGSIGSQGAYRVAVLQEGRIYDWNREAPTSRSTLWRSHARYRSPELVTYVATAADVAAVSSLVSGTTYVYRSTVPPLSGSYGRRNELNPPPRDASRWELVGTLGDVAEADRPSGGVSVGDWAERLARASGTWSWQDVSAEGLTPNHCFHYPHSVDLVESLYRTPDGAPARAPAVRTTYRWGPDNIDFGTTDPNDFWQGVARLAGTFFGQGAPTVFESVGLGRNHALEVAATVWRALPDPVKDLLRTILSTKNLGWWTILFEAPMPDDGSTYRPPVLDINNRNMTPSGSSGWGAADAEDLGRITGIRFMLNFDKRVGPFRIPFRGNIPFRCWVVDSESAVWHQDFSYSLLGTNQEVRLDFSNFTRLHSRAPVEVENAILNVILPELRTAPGFNSRTIKLVGLHLLDNYDESGRYWPFFSPWNNLFEFGGRAITNSPVDHIGTVDGLAFIKSPIAVANEGPGENSAPAGRTIAAPITERPNISNYVQLKAATEALADLNAWRLDNYTIRVPGRVDVLAESSIVLKDPRLISEEDVSGQPGTLKLTVTRVSWSVTADFRGWYTEMTCYRRINRGAVT